MLKCFYFGSVKGFEEFTNYDLKLNKWIIQDKTIDERYEQVKNYSYVKKLKELANKIKMEYDETEIISWLDSQSIMLIIIQYLYKYKNKYDYLLNDIKIIQEYHIPFTNKRADYLLIKDNKILIIEFSYSKHKNTKYQYQTKLNQVINYKELISNIISKNIEIGTYTFILNPEEYCIESNHQECRNFIDYIDYFFQDRKINALDELKKIPYDYNKK